MYTLFFLFLLKNIDCGLPTIYVLSRNMKKYQIFFLSENFPFIWIGFFFVMSVSLTCFLLANDLSFVFWMWYAWPADATGLGFCSTRLVPSRIRNSHILTNIFTILPPNTENFQIKNSDIFHISAQNIDCGYSLEPSRRGDSNEYQQSMFLS